MNATLPDDSQTSVAGEEDPGAGSEIGAAAERPPGRPGPGEKACPDCGGSGKRAGCECPACGGTGRLTVDGGPS